jgi:hypothetical protein
MAQWLVTQGDNQFAVEGLAGLKELAGQGRLSGGDMVQPPGATDWMYAAEIPDLAELLNDDAGDDDLDYNPRKGKMGAGLTIVLVLVLLSVVVGGVAAASMFFTQLPRGDETLIGAGGLSYSEMLVTSEGVSLLAKPEAGAGAVAALQKDESLELLAKRGEFYRARNKGNAEGWIRVDQVIPMYQLGGSDVHEKYDPLYNPDRYVEVMNASWMQLPDQREENITIFEFMLKNQSIYPMTDVVILATIKDAKGQELERLEIPLEGLVPFEGTTMVGTLKPEPKPKKKDEEEEAPRLLTNYSFAMMAKENPDLQLRYQGGVEVKMKSEDFTNANIDFLELRAVPDSEAEKAVTRRN